MRTSSLLAVISAAASMATADTVMGFNYGSTGNDQDAFEAQFKAASDLSGTSGFSSARLYTMIQDGTTNTPISAIPAAIAQKTTLLLGLWASAGQAQFDNEIAALKAAIKQYGSDFADAVVGISVGSEDLYRITDTSTIVNKDPNPGAAPDTLVSYIKQVRDTIKGTALSSKPVGHVDTYTAFINGSNKAVIDNIDFLGMDTYPYYETTESNGIDNAYNLFFSAYDQTKSAAGGKPVWVTETGWPTSGSKKYNLAEASVENAETYWQQIGCALFGKTNVWWFDLADGGADPLFGVVGSSINNKPLYDLKCDPSKAAKSTSSKSSASKTSSRTATPASSSSSNGKPSSGSRSGSSTTRSSSSRSSDGATSSSTDPASSSGSGSGTNSAGAVSTTSSGLGSLTAHAELGSLAMCIMGAFAFLF